ncbi:MAG: RNA 2',3'-cyclic phosphodiesterase [Candidatus Heimdallarchaeota archaeon]|nr:MAG: RNA 2',3'-cyclic phosphodiesterase [Candidatus Heimdallarchaeota archaeon]
MMVRSFICVEINDSEVVKPIEELLVKLRFNGVRPVKSFQLHLTLKFLGEVSESQIGSIKQVIQLIEFSPFEISLTGMGCFPNLNYIRVVWIGIREGSNNLKQLASMIEEKLNPLGFPREKRGFSPHLTLARIKKLRNPDKRKLTAIIQSSKEISFGDQLIEEFILKKSTLTPKGPIYEDLLVVPAKE